MATTTAPALVTRTIDTSSIAIPVPRRAAVHWERHYVTLATVTDAGIGFVAGVAAFLTYPGADPAPTAYFVLTLLLPFVWVAAVALAGGYQRRFLSVGPEEFNRIGVAALSVLALIGTSSWLTGLPLSRTYVAIALLVSATGSLVGRYLLRKHVHHQRGRGGYQRRTILIGGPDSVTELAGHLGRYQYHGYEVVGACLTDDEQHGADLRSSDGTHISNLGSLEDVRTAIRSNHADTVAVTSSSSLDANALRRLSWQLESLGTNLFVAPSVMEVAGPRLSVHPVEGVPLLRIDPPSLTGAKQVVKGVGDIVLASIGLMVLAPVLLAIGLVVRWDSPGPALFRQTRIGRYGEPFSIVKFRTMVVDAERRRDEVEHLNEASGPLYKAARDPRVTPVGSFLRRTSLDELPQLWNVLLGQMSLVGPRPYLPAEIAASGQVFRRRLLAKPGMTGLWQISGRSDLSWEESVRTDLRYVENWSLGLDIMIMWKTLGVVARGSGAY